MSGRRKGILRRILLRPNETMAQYRARRAFETECAAVVSVIRNRPGIGSAGEIAAVTGIDAGRVADCLTAINANETGYVRVEYGQAVARSGPHAGDEVWGWFCQDVAAYQRCMDYADRHSMLVEAGVRRSRMARYLYAQGLNTAQARAVIAHIEDRMAVPVSELTPAQAVTFRKLAEKQAAEFIADLNGG